MDKPEKDARIPSGEWFASALDSVDDLVLIKGDRSKLLWANRAFRELYNMSNQELYDLVDGEHSDPDDTLQYVRDDHQVFTTGEPLRVTEPVTSSEGEVRYFDTVKSAIVDDGGKVVRTIGISRPPDAGEQIELSKERREARKATGVVLRNVIAGLPLPVLVLDVNCRVVAASQGFVEFVDHGDAVGLEFERAFDHKRELGTQLAKAIDAGEASSTRLRQGDKQLDVFVHAWLLPDETIGGAIVTISDVTSLYESEEHLKKANSELEIRNRELAAARRRADMEMQQLRSLVDMLSVGVVVVSKDNESVLWNEEAARLLGTSSSEVASFNDPRRLGLRDESGNLLTVDSLPLARALRGESVRDELLQIRGDDEETKRWILVSAARISEESTLGTGLAVFVDITRQIELQRELEDFAHIASHDLQEPLRMIGSFIELLADSTTDVLDDDAQKYMSFISEGASRMRLLISGLLAFSRLSQGELETRAVQLQDVVDDALSTFGPLLNECGGKIVVEEMPSVQADPAAMSHLVNNLVSNAIKFRDPKRPLVVEIRACRENGEWRIAVADNGIGFDPAYRSKIFEKFERLHSRATHPGTGIGLALCKRIVERHGGRIGVETKPEVGSTFWFLLRDATVAADEAQIA